MFTGIFSNFHINGYLSWKKSILVLHKYTSLFFSLLRIFCIKSAFLSDTRSSPSFIDFRIEFLTVNKSGIIDIKSSHFWLKASKITRQRFLRLNLSFCSLVQQYFRRIVASLKLRKSEMEKTFEGIFILPIK